MGVKSTSAALTRIKAGEKQVGDIVIVLMHDTKKITREYLPGVIEHFKELGYVFRPLCLDSPAIHHSW
jgi:peptidoglycan/xylan/chitin deacetylase (PgdA/CDA1 family)